MQESVRTTVVLPASVAELLRDLVPPRKRSHFIAEAIQEHLRLLAFRRARVRSFGAWSDEEHPELHTADDMRRYLGEMRGSAAWRSVAPEEE